MKKFSNEDIKALAKAGKISGKDHLAILLQAKEAIEKAPIPEVTDVAVLTEIRNVLALIAAKIPSPNDILPATEQQVIVNLPPRGAWVATVAERDKDGFIKKVTFKETKA